MFHTTSISLSLLSLSRNLGNIDLLTGEVLVSYFITKLVFLREEYLAECLFYFWTFQDQGWFKDCRISSKTSVCDFISYVSSKHLWNSNICCLDRTYPSADVNQTIKWQGWQRCRNAYRRFLHVVSAVCSFLQNSLLSLTRVRASANNSPVLSLLIVVFCCSFWGCQRLSYRCQSKLLSKIMLWLVDYA